jgi:hypothetical protein
MASGNLAEMQRATLRTGIAAALLTVVTGCATAPREQTITWDVMQWRSVEAAVVPVVERGDVLLRGQDVRTQAAYTAPLTVELEAQLERREATASMLTCRFVPTNQSAEAAPKEFVAIMLQYSPTGDVLVVMRRSDPSDSGETILGQPVTHHVGQPYRLKIEATKESLRITLNGQLYEVPAAKISYDKFHIELSGVPPANRWRVRKFVIR